MLSTKWDKTLAEASFALKGFLHKREAQKSWEELRRQFIWDILSKWFRLGLKLCKDKTTENKISQCESAREHDITSSTLMIAWEISLMTYVSGILFILQNAINFSLVIYIFHFLLTLNISCDAMKITRICSMKVSREQIKVSPHMFRGW